MALYPSTKLSDGEKLEVLRRLDQFRHWHSLDDRRYCLVCGNLITGRQIRIAGGTRGNGSLRLSCPSERCHSIPMDWVLPTDEILAKIEKLAAEERKASAVNAAAAIKADRSIEPANKQYEHFLSRLLRLAFHLKWHSRALPSDAGPHA